MRKMFLEDCQKRRGDDNFRGGDCKIFSNDKIEKIMELPKFLLNMEFNDLPGEVILIILEKVHPGLWNLLKLVCKRWYRVVPNLLIPQWRKKRIEMRVKKYGCKPFNLCRYGVRYNNPEILKWARDNCCRWDKITFRIAVIVTINENLGTGLLDWVRDNGCPLDNVSFKFATEQIIIKNRGIEVLEWVKNNGIPFCNFTRKTLCNFATEKNRFDILIWAKKNGFESSRQQLYRTAARYGNLDCLKWLKKENPTYTIPRVTYSATSDDNFECLKWLIENGCRLHSSVPSLLCKKGNLEMLIWLRENYPDWNKSERRKKIFQSARKKIFQSALEYGKVKIVEWIGIPENYKFPSNDYLTCSEKGYLEILKWLRNCDIWEVNCSYVLRFHIPKKGIPRHLVEDLDWDRACYNVAEHFGNENIMEWINGLKILS